MFDGIYLCEIPDFFKMAELHKMWWVLMANITRQPSLDSYTKTNKKNRFIWHVLIWQNITIIENAVF